MNSTGILSAFDSLAEPVLAVAAESEVVYANHAAGRLFGLAASDLAERRLDQLLSPVGVPLAELLSPAPERGPCPVRVKLTDGSLAEVSVSPAPDGEAARVLLVVRSSRGGADPVHHVDGDQAADARRLETAVELAEIGSWTADVRADQVHWDAHAGDLLNIGGTAGRGTMADFFKAVPHEDVAALQLTLEEALTHDSSFRLMHRVVVGDRIRWIEQRGRPQAADGATRARTHIAGVAMEVTDRVEADQQLATSLANERTARARTEAAFAEARDVAETLQKSLLPSELPRVPGVELATLYRASTMSPATVGGDFYDVFPISRHDWGLVVGDVCGKGPEAAVLTARIRHGVRALAPRARRTDHLVSAVDDTLEADALGHRFCTMVYARFTPLVDGIDVRLTRAGHPAPMLVRADGSTEELGVPGPMLGVGHLGAWNERRVHLDLGDQLALYTDGVTELRSDSGEMFGEERLREALAETIDSDGAATIMRRLEQRLLDFQGEPRDDIAVLLLRAPPLRDSAA